MAFFDLQIPFFIPIWRRVLLILICLGWAGFELASGELIWAIIFTGIGGFAAWQLFFSNWPDSNSHSDHR